MIVSRRSTFININGTLMIISLTNYIIFYNFCNDDIDLIYKFFIILFTYIIQNYLIMFSLYTSSISEASISKASISEASISEASISEASIIEASISEASISEASISEASIRKASISEASISEASISEASISEASINNKRIQNMFQEDLSLKNDNDSNKLLHRYNCNSNLPLIRNIIIPDIKLGCRLETVLIEFRILPHLEFLLRNTIIKFPNWSHTVVCGNLNYKFIQKMCLEISSNINIICLDINNLTPSDYSKLLMTSEFWMNFTGEMILLYQEDTMLFHNMIDEFLKYDYVGASWPINQDDNSVGVGNGGFSLRNKNKMLECIAKVNPKTDLKLGQSTLTYMKNTNSYSIPEDVYFTKSLIEHNIGLVADRNTANKFSQESQLCINPLGGHNYWLPNDNKIKISFNFILENDYYNKVTHRGGWKTIITELLNNNILLDSTMTNNNSTTMTNKKNNNSNIITFIDCIESYFSWYSDIKPITKNWIGIIHYSPQLPSFLKHNLDSVLNDKIFIQSLKFCKGLIVLSKNSEMYIKKNPIYKNINITSMKHPIPNEFTNKFSLEQFLKKNIYNVIQLGQQDRIVTTIYRLKTKYKKIWLSGILDNNRIIELLKNEIDYLKLNNMMDNTKIDINSVKLSYLHNVVEYDLHLLNNIIIIPLWGASANNSILEIIEMNIPAFITRVSAAEEYLGKEYPMFYSEIYEIENIINNQKEFRNKYIETYKYLIKMDKTELKLSVFKSELVKFFISCPFK